MENNKNNLPSLSMNLKLERALNSKTHKNTRNQSTQRFVSDVSLSSNSEDLHNDNRYNLEQKKPIEIVEVDVHDGNNFILNKFLNDSSKMREEAGINVESEANDELFKKPLLYRPRRKKKKETDSISSSNITYNIHTVEEKVSSLQIDSQDGYEIEEDEFQQIQTYKDDKSKFSNLDQIKYESEVKSEESNKTYLYNTIFAITIHKTDRLKLNSLVIHPVVKIHLVNSETGEYLHKSDNDRPVIYYYEDRSIKYIPPIISEPYNLYDKRSIYPFWEETLIINEDLEYVLAQKNHTVVFFEIMDFVPFSVASAQFHQKGASKGWHKIAWAFLKPVGKYNTSNLNKIARLQLYYPGKQMKVSQHICDIFHWWKNKKLIKYPSSLYVTIDGILRPEKSKEMLRSKTPIHEEKASNATLATDVSSQSLQDYLLNASGGDGDSNLSRAVKSPFHDITWSRSSYQTCKLPNKCINELSTYSEGCLLVKFSRTGHYMASAVLIDDGYWIIVYSVKTYEEVCRYLGHQGLIYDISWSEDDNFIITASADCTVSIWNIVKNVFVEMLPHPSYVYANKIYANHCIATGCYDKIVRIWQSQSGFNLLQELEKHNGYITSLCFNKKGTLLYSSDSIGIIIEWKHDESKDSWYFKREFKLVNLKKMLIDQVLLHNQDRRLLVHARDSVLRIIDVKTGSILYWLHGGENNRYKSTCTFSACGTFVLAATENGFVNVWNSDIGKLVATYTPYEALNRHNLAIHCVDFHPYDNIIAVSHYGSSVPILVAVYDPEMDGKSNIGLKLLQKKEANTFKKKKGKSSLDLRSTSDAITDITTVDEKQEHIKFQTILNKMDEIVNYQINVSDSCIFNMQQ